MYKLNKNNLLLIFLEAIDLHISAEDEELLYASDTEMEKPIQVATPKKAANLTTSKKAVTRMASKKAASMEKPDPEDDRMDYIDNNETQTESEAYDNAASEVNNHWEEPSEEEIKRMAFQKYKEEKDPAKRRYTYNSRRYVPAIRKELDQAKAEANQSRPHKKAKLNVPDHSHQGDQTTQDEAEDAPLDLSKKSPGKSRSPKKLLDPRPFKTRLNWKERAQRQATRSDPDEVDINLQFYFESEVFNRYIPGKQFGKVVGTPHKATITKSKRGFQDNTEFYKNVKHEAYEHLEKTRSYKEFVNKGYTMTFKFRFYYEYKSEITNKIELRLATEPWWGATSGNPEKPHGREGIYIFKIWMLCTGVPDPKEPSPKRSRSKQEQNKPRSKLKLPKNQVRPQPASAKEKDLRQVLDSGRVLTEKELQITGVPKGTHYFELASKGRRNIRRLNEKWASQKEAADIATIKPVPSVLHKWDRELTDRERDLLRVNSGITYNRLTGKQRLKLIEVAQKDYESEATRRIQKHFQQCLCPTGEHNCEAQPMEEMDAVEDDWDKPLPTAPITQYVVKRPRQSPSRSPNKNNFPTSNINPKPLQTVSPFKKHQIPEEEEEEEDDIEEEDLRQFESDGSDDEDGLNKREREYLTTKQACTNAIKRLKAIAAYSAIWMPDEQAHKLEELYIQFRLESQKLSIASHLTPMRPRRLMRALARRTTMVSNDQTSKSQPIEDLRTRLKSKSPRR